MKIALAISTLLFSFIAHAAEKPQTRCGWIENPTPANYWLLDAQGEWTISVQGGYQAEGDLVYPADYDRDYVKTNVNYGYFCGCITATVNPKLNRVIKIFSASAKTLQACLSDSKLKQEFRPRYEVHSSGKAYTECQDQDEQQIGYMGRQACVNEKGDFYFLADEGN